jgi:hypothetical protein
VQPDNGSAWSYSLLVRQCSQGRLPDTQAHEREAGAWCEERNRLGTSVDWRFTTQKMPASSCANSIHQLTLDGGLGTGVWTAFFGVARAGPWNACVKKRKKVGQSHEASAAA